MCIFKHHDQSIIICAVPIFKTNKGAEIIMIDYENKI